MSARTVASIITGCVITFMPGIGLAAEEPAPVEGFRPFDRTDHRLALLAESQALRVDHAVLAAARNEVTCTFERVPLGLIGEVDLELDRQQVVAPVWLCWDFVCQVVVVRVVLTVDVVVKRSKRSLSKKLEDQAEAQVVPRRR